MLTVILALSEFTENIRNILFENAPTEYFYLIFYVGILISVLIGIRGIFRASTIIAPVIILGIVLLFNQDNNNVGNDNQYTNISSDEFIGTIIANDNYQITVIPNEDELIRQSSFDIINVAISENTKTCTLDVVYNNEDQSTSCKVILALLTASLIT